MKEVFYRDPLTYEPVMIPIGHQVHSRVKGQIYKWIRKQVENDIDSQVGDQVEEELA